MRGFWKIWFSVAVVLLCGLRVAGQEIPLTIDEGGALERVEEHPSVETPPDETLHAVDTIVLPASDIIFISDTIPFTDIFPYEDMYSAHSPAKAAIMSAVLPGLGQVYNRKYWKVPIVYIAIGVSVERFVTFQNEFNRYRRAYIDLNDGDPYTNFHLTLFPPNTPEAQMNQWVNRGREKFRTWRDWAVVAVVASYALNIIDANVDAHLMDFSLDDNISLKIQPIILEDHMFSKKIGLSLRLAF